MQTTSTVERWAFHHPDLPWPLVVDAPCVPDRTMEQRARNLFYRLMIPLIREGIEDFRGGYLFPLAAFASVEEAEATSVDSDELADICEILIEETSRWETPALVGTFYVADFLSGGES